MGRRWAPWATDEDIRAHEARFEAQVRRTEAAVKTSREAKRLAAGRAAAQIVLGATALRAAKRGPRGLGLGTSDLFARNADGSYAINAVSLDRIPARRAVRVGKQVHDSASIRQLLARDPRAPNPLTRQPFPEHVYRKYGPPSRRPRRPRSVLAAGPPPAAGQREPTAANLVRQRFGATSFDDPLIQGILRGGPRPRRQ